MPSVTVATNHSSFTLGFDSRQGLKDRSKKKEIRKWVGVKGYKVGQKKEKRGKMKKNNKNYRVKKKTKRKRRI